MHSTGTASAYEITEEGAKVINCVCTCAVHKGGKVVDNTQEKGTWNDVSACLTGDFAGVGCDQILMLSNEGTTTIPPP